MNQNVLNENLKKNQKCLQNLISKSYNIRVGSPIANNWGYTGLLIGHWASFSKHIDSAKRYKEGP